MTATVATLSVSGAMSATGYTVCSKAINLGEHEL